MPLTKYGRSAAAVSDITYIALKSGKWAYLATYMDLYTRKIVGNLEFPCIFISLNHVEIAPVNMLGFELIFKHKKQQGYQKVSMWFRERHCTIMMFKNIMIFCVILEKY
jgi:hypothetical protein